MHRISNPSTYSKPIQPKSKPLASLSPELARAVAFMNQSIARNGLMFDYESEAHSGFSTSWTETSEDVLHTTMRGTATFHDLPQADVDKMEYSLFDALYVIHYDMLDRTYEKGIRMKGVGYTESNAEFQAVDESKQPVGEKVTCAVDFCSLKDDGGQIWDIDANTYEVRGLHLLAPLVLAGVNLPDPVRLLKEARNDEEVWSSLSETAKERYLPMLDRLQKQAGERGIY